MMKKVIGIICSSIFPLLVFGQSYSKRFDEAFRKRDTTLQHSILTDWWLDNSNSPDLAVAQFRFHKERYVSIGDSVVRQKALTQAFSAINRGIALYPDRLDIRFFKIGMLDDLSDFEAYTREIITVLDHNDNNKGEWLWKENATLNSASEFLLEYVNNYVVQLYNRQDPALHVYMDSISNRIIASYPNHVPSLSNLAITALYREDYESGIAYLRKAITIDSMNTNILNNLAYAYEQIGNISQAITCYEQIVEYGDTRASDHANRKLKELRAENQKKAL